jgi:hypothetical protein
LGEKKSVSSKVGVRILSFQPQQAPNTRNFKPLFRPLAQLAFKGMMFP